MTILVTGVAGFIGFHVAKNLTEKGQTVIGIDNLNDYYDVNLKKARLDQLVASPLFSFHRADIADKYSIEPIVSNNKEITCVIHLAAQAGVRYSLVNPYSYVRANLHGVLVLLEVVRSLSRLEHFIFASSSSVYGGSRNLPYSITDKSDKPISFYGATKKGGEGICHSYSHIYNIPITCLRFFTVYGPWGRPDMAAYIFTKKILSGEQISVFNHGNMRRDFTYIDDCVAGILSCMSKQPVSINSAAPFTVFNIGNSRSEKLMDFIKIIECEIGREAIIKFLPMQKGDVAETYADIEETKKAFGFDPKIDISEGLVHFIRWYKDYHKTISLEGIND